MGQKFSLPEVIILVMIAAGVDGLEILTAVQSPIPILGQIILFAEPLIDVPTWATIQFWFFLKGQRGLLILGGNLVELIPLVDFLPLRTITLIIAIILANKPAATAALGTAIKAEGLVRGMTSGAKGTAEGPKKEEGAIVPQQPREPQASTASLSNIRDLAKERSRRRPPKDVGASEIEDLAA